MLCPFCNQEMIKGTLQGKAGTYFLPEGVHRPWIYTEKSMEKKGALLLPPFPLRAPGEPVLHSTAYCCKACRKIIIEYDAE